MNEPPRHYTVRQAKELASLRLGYAIPRSTWYRIVAEGNIEAMRIGAKRIIKFQEIEAFIARAQGGRRW